MAKFSDILLTVDFDRTLTAPDTTIPERNMEAIRYFMENGGTFTVNTGRSVPSFRHFMEIIPVNAPFLLYNGSAAYADGKLINQYQIDLPLWDVIHTMEKEFPDAYIEVQGIDNHYLINQQDDISRMYDRIDWPHLKPEDGQDLGPFLKFSIVGKPDQDRVDTWFHGTPQQNAYFDWMAQRIRELYGEKVAVFRAAARIIDVHAKGVSKITAARNLQKQLGKKILICVGDADNDLAMLEGADYAFCPSDGVMADQFPNVCPCGEGAVADVIYNKIPELLEK